MRADGMCATCGHSPYNHLYYGPCRLRVSVRGHFFRRRCGCPLFIAKVQEADRGE